MTQLVVTLKDQSYLPNIRRIVKSLQGVERVSVPRKKVAQNPVATKRTQSSATFLKGQATPETHAPLEALEDIGQLVRGTGKSSRQLIDEYLAEKYGV